MSTELTIRYGDYCRRGCRVFSIERGESVGLVGESGSGKSQTALAILGLLPQQATVSGSIRFDGQRMLGAANKTLNPCARRDRHRVPGSDAGAEPLPSDRRPAASR